jgi:hypothetical protein
MEAGDGPVLISALILGYAFACVLASDQQALDDLLAMDGDLAKHAAFKRLVPALSGKTKSDDDPTLSIA